MTRLLKCILCYLKRFWIHQTFIYSSSCLRWCCDSLNLDGQGVTKIPWLCYPVFTLNYQVVHDEDVELNHNLLIFLSSCSTASSICNIDFKIIVIFLKCVNQDIMYYFYWWFLHGLTNINLLLKSCCYYCKWLLLS